MDICRNCKNWRSFDDYNPNKGRCCVKQPKRNQRTGDGDWPITSYSDWCSKHEKKGGRLMKIKIIKMTYDGLTQEEEFEDSRILSIDFEFGESGISISSAGNGIFVSSLKNRISIEPVAANCVNVFQV